MAIVKLETGEELEFDNNYSDEQISQAVEEYLGQKPTQQPKQEGSVLGNIARGLPVGLGRAATGFVQAATDLGEGAARGIEKAIYGDTMDQQTFGDRLAGQVQQQNQQLAQEPLSTRFGVGVGEVLPYLATGAGTGKAVSSAIGGATGRIAGLGAAGAVGGATQQALSAQEQAGLQNRLEKTGEGAVMGAAFGAGLGALGEGVRVVSKPASKLTTAIVDRVKSELGNKEIAKKLATTQLKEGLAREGIDIAEALKQTSQEGKDLVDILDPRLATLNKGLRNLNRPETIKIADQSLARINQTTNKLQDEVLNLVSNNKITPEQAGDILGRNSKKLFDKAIAARTAKVEPLYKEALAEGIKINPKAKAETGESLSQILRSPFMQKVLNDVRSNSSEFAGTPASKFYGDLHQKTKPVYIKAMIGRDPFTGTPIFEQAIKTPSKFKIPDNDIRTLHAIEKELNNMLSNPQAITGVNVDIASIKANKNAISKFLDEASPKLTMARKQYSRLTQEIKGEGKSLLGKYAKMYSEGRTDELTKSAMDILKLPPNRIIKAKQINPQEFNDLLRASFENKIASIQPLDEGVINPKAFTKAFFADGGKALEAATDKETAKGFRRLAENLDIRYQRNRIAKGAMESQAKSVRVPTGKSSALNRVLEFAEDRIVSSPAAQKEFVNGLFTPQGQEMLRTIANSEKKVQEQIINNFMRETILLNLLSKSASPSEADASEMSQDGFLNEEQFRNQLIQQRQNYPSIAGDINPELEAEIYRKRYLK
jgi:hypothetical protein